MESVAETVKYFRSVSEMIKGSTLAFEKTAEPFCMLSWVMKDDCPADFILMGFNPAFKKLVNGKATICAPLSSLCSDKVVNFWVEKLYPIINGVPEVKVYNYYSNSYGKSFDLVVAFPAELLGHKGVAMIFFEKLTKYSIDLSDELVKEAEFYGVNIEETVEKYINSLRGIYP